MQSLVASCMCPDWGLNPQPWHSWVMLQPTELPSQGWKVSLCQKRICCEEVYLVVKMWLCFQKNRELLSFTRHVRQGWDLALENEGTDFPEEK